MAMQESGQFEKTLRALIAVALLATAPFVFISCVHNEVEMPSAAEVEESSPQQAELDAGWELYHQNKYNEAMLVCQELQRRYPEEKRVSLLRNAIIEAQLDQRSANLGDARDLSNKQMALETSEAGLLPSNYGVKRYVEAAPMDQITSSSPMRKVLARLISMHLQNADLGVIIAALAQDPEINILADKDVGKGKKIDIEIDGVPLRELLDYLTRNMGVRFYVGHNTIWVTSEKAKASDQGKLETRVYHLRQGLQLHGNDWGQANAKIPSDSTDMGVLRRNATVLPSEKSYFETIVEQFVPKVEGAAFYVDRNMHTLFVRNTADNLEVIEQLVEALDVAPPQVSITARFVEVSLNDLQELGMEWVLDSSLALSTKSVWEDGEWVDATAIEAEAGNVVNYTPYGYDPNGSFDLGPQGAFASLRDANPATNDQGLNMNFSGILTDPSFKAILHALEISGKGHTLSVPRVTTVNNNPAKLRNGTDQRFYEKFKAQAFKLVDSDNKSYTVTALIPDGTPAIEELGITLLAVPSVGADRKSISLLLTPTISELVGWESYQDTGSTNVVNSTDVQQVVVKLPQFARREVQTKVIVQSGETVVLGGLIDTVMQETVHKIPFIGDIPLLGALFRRTDITEERKNLLIFVTATVLSDRGESLLPVWTPLDDTPVMLDEEPILVSKPPVAEAPAPAIVEVGEGADGATE